jgi:cyclic pyranopterin phosphate synthase
MKMLDQYGREITYLRLSVTELCNLRCRYCMPEDGVCKKRHDEMLTQEETIMAIRAAATLGIRKLRITGGEPLVKANIVELCREAASVDGISEVCLTTNATLLPKLAEPLHAAGVNRLNISLDTLNAEKYRYITRLGTLDAAVEGLEAALSCGFQKIKINSVLIGGFNDDEIPALADLTRKYPVDVRFIELMPMYDSGDFGPEAFIPYTTVTDRLPELTPVPADGGVAKLFRLPGAQGNVGLISPVSAHFCTECNRIRLTADGKLKPCLHSSDEISLKGLDFNGMLETMRSAILAKPQWHGELSYRERSRANRNMNQIGG